MTNEIPTFLGPCHVYFLCLPIPPSIREILLDRDAIATTGLATPEAVAGPGYTIMTVPLVQVGEAASLDIQKLLAKCEELVCRFEYDVALKFCEKILLSVPTHVDTLMMKATIFIDMGENDKAKQVLLDAVAAESERGAEKYTALAQLCEGEAALANFHKAISILQSEQTDTDGEGEAQRQAQIAALFCSMAEIYLTDLCEQEDAEQRCDSYVQAALQADPNSYEALQTMSNMKLSQSKMSEAAESLKQSIALWSSIPFEDEDYPSYEFRLVCSRLLVELGLFGEAKVILETLSQEDDEILEVWYLLSLSLYSLRMLEEAKSALENALIMLQRDTDQTEEMMEAVGELQEVLGMSGFDKDGAMEEEDDADDETGDDGETRPGAPNDDMEI